MSKLFSAFVAIGWSPSVARSGARANGHDCMTPGYNSGRKKECRIPTELREGLAWRRSARGEDSVTPMAAAEAPARKSSH
jgi:hypothetical protein